MRGMNPMNPAPDSELLNVLIRLMTPFRRQFQQILEVHRFLIDEDYAQEVVDQLLTADDPRIVGLAQVLCERIQVKGLVQPKHVSIVSSLAVPVAHSAAPSQTTPATSELAPDLALIQGEQVAKYVKRLR